MSLLRGKGISTRRSYLRRPLGWSIRFLGTGNSVPQPKTPKFYEFDLEAFQRWVGGQEILPSRLNEMISQPIVLKTTLAPVVRLDNRPFFYSEE